MPFLGKSEIDVTSGIPSLLVLIVGQTNPFVSSVALHLLPFTVPSTDCSGLLSLARMPETQKCLRCGRLVAGELEGLPLSMCCLLCCRKYRAPIEGRYAGLHRVTRTFALSNAGLKEEELGTLHCAEFYAGRDQPVLRLYLGAEVECLSKNKHPEKYNLQKLTDKRDLSQKLRILLDNFDPILLCFAIDQSLIGDRGSESYLSVMAIVLSALKRAQVIRQNCPLAHPAAAIAFCIDNPDKGAFEFEQEKERVTKVFQVAGSRIMQFLTKQERKALLDTPLKDVVEEFELRDKRNIIREWLETWRPQEEVQEIMEHPACQLTISRADDCLLTSVRLLEFWDMRSDTMLRELALETTFVLENIPSDKCLPCYQAFVHGQIDCECEELVGVQYLLGSNYGKEERLRKVRALIALTFFEQNMIDKELGLVNSIRAAETSVRKLHAAVLTNTDSWDFQQLTRGFWSQKMKTYLGF